MKNLKDTIYEKLKVDDIIIDEEFPIDEKKEVIIEFLEKEGFKYVLCDGNIDEEFNKNKCKCLHQIDNKFWFADTSKGKISRDNPVFLIKFIAKGRIFSIYYREFGMTKYKVSDDREEFLEELNKRFGWK